MEKYIIRQEYFGASMLDADKLDYRFLEQRETDMLKLLQYNNLEMALGDMVRSVDPSIANIVTNNMLSFVDTQKKAGTIKEDNSPNYTIRQMTVPNRTVLPRESLKAPLKICVDLSEHDLTYSGHRSSRNPYNTNLSDPELYKIIHESRNADVLGLMLITQQYNVGPESHNIMKLSEHAKNIGLGIAIYHDSSDLFQKFMPFNRSLQNNRIVCDLDLENCVKELNINFKGDVSYYCPKNNSSVNLGNIRSHNYSVADLWDVYRDSTALCNSSEVTHQEIWRD